MAQNPFAATVMRVLSGGSFFQRQPQGNPQLMASNISGMWVGQRVPPLYESTYAGSTFMAATQGTGATLSSGLATTYTGFCLSNPAGSGKNLVLTNVSLNIIVAAAAAQGYGLITGWAAGGITVHTTPITAWGTALVGGAATSIAKVDAACTLVGTPVWSRWIGFAATAVAGPFSSGLDGGLLIAPGGYVAIGAQGAAGPTAGLLASMAWTEEAIA